MAFASVHVQTLCSDTRHASVALDMMQAELFTYDKLQDCFRSRKAKIACNPGAAMQYHHATPLCSEAVLTASIPVSYVTLQARYERTSMSDQHS